MPIQFWQNSRFGVFTLSHFQLNLPKFWTRIFFVMDIIISNENDHILSDQYFQKMRKTRKGINNTRKATCGDSSKTWPDWTKPMWYLDSAHQFYPKSAPNSQTTFKKWNFVDQCYHLYLKLMYFTVLCGANVLHIKCSFVPFYQFCTKVYWISYVLFQYCLFHLCCYS